MHTKLHSYRAKGLSVIEKNIETTYTTFNLTTNLITSYWFGTKWGGGKWKISKAQLQWNLFLTDCFLRTGFTISGKVTLKNKSKPTNSVYQFVITESLLNLRFTVSKKL